MSRAVVEADKSPKLIPRVIHQTYKSSSVPANLKVFMHSWRRLNEDWEIRFYDDEACMKFVQWEFPEYLDAYRSLENNIERSDFFRQAPVATKHRSRFFDHSGPYFISERTRCTQICLLLPGCSLGLVRERHFVS